MTYVKMLLLFLLSIHFLISRGHVNEVVQPDCREKNKMYVNIEDDSMSLFFVSAHVTQQNTTN